MPLSRYHITVPLAATPDRLLLYSTAKASLATLDATAYRLLAQGETPPEALRAGLERLGLWVADLAAEEEAMLRFTSEINQARNKATVAIILGMACNFACRYCYEGKLKDTAVAMSAETVDQACRFLLTWCQQLGLEKLVLSFYGGEPLLYPNLIRRFATQLRPALAAEGVGFSFTLVTNGSLLTPEWVAELVSLGLTALRTTIDGPAECHNHSRPCKNGAPSFDTIVDAVATVHHLVRVDVGGNFTRHNWQRFPELLDQLDARGLGPEQLGYVNFAAAMGVTDTIANTGFTGCSSVNEPWHAQAVVALREAILARGYKSAKTSAALCMADVHDSMVIHHDGGLYKCPALIGHQQFQAGDIWQGPQATERVYALGHWQRESRCRQCRFLPLCLGGCRYAAYQRNGSLDEVDCQYGYFEAALPGLLEQEQRYRHPDGAQPDADRIKGEG